MPRCAPPPPALLCWPVSRYLVQLRCRAGGGHSKKYKSEGERSFGSVLSRSVHLNLLHFLRSCICFPLECLCFIHFGNRVASDWVGTSGQRTLTQLREGPAEGLLLVCSRANTRCPVNRLTPSHKHGTIHLHVCVGRLREQEGMFHYIAPDLVVMQKSEVGGDPFPLL